MNRSDLCFSTLGCTEYSVNELIELSRKFSIKAIELRGLCGSMSLYESEDFSPDNIENTLALFAKEKISFPVLGTSIACHELFSGKQTYEDAEKDIAFAKRIGSKYVRVFGNRITDTCASLEVAAVLEKLCAVADNYGIVVLLEVHGDYNTAETLRPITNALSRPDNFGLIWDVCHTDAVYGDKWIAFYEEFKHAIRHVHIKDRDRERMTLTAIGKGDIPIKEIVRQLRTDDFEGFISLEWERRWHKELSPIEDALSDFLSLTELVK